MFMHIINYIHVHGLVSLAILKIIMTNCVNLLILPYGYQRAKLFHIFTNILIIILDVYYQLYHKVSVSVKTLIFTWILS